MSEAVGRWGGHEIEVVYDPRRYDVMLLTEARADASITTALAADGWQRRAADGDRTLWTRDRLAATRTALARLDPAVDVGGAALAPATGRRSASERAEVAATPPPAAAATPKPAVGMEPPAL